ncbi:hypothetical protein PRIC1_008423 [Phytophthora ramorum]
MHKDPVEKVSLQQDDNNEGWEELRDKLSTNGPVASISGRVGRDLESNDDSDNETLSNSAKREQEEKEHDEAQLSDYTGASAITVCCLVLPLVFYLKVFWRDLPVYERVVALVVIVVCTIVGCYVMIYAGKNLFNPDSDSATFPYCSEEYQSEPYYVRNATTSA